ncbi:MAG: hypothetical protein RL630_1060 [Verrucomicrobiota bacterium]
MTAQQLHDLKMRKGVNLQPGSRKVLEGLLQKKNLNSDSLSQSQPQSEIEWAMKRFSGLTREEAEAMAATQGF